VNKFKKENDDNGTEDKNEIGIGKIIFIFFFKFKTVLHILYIIKNYE